MPALSVNPFTAMGGPLSLLIIVPAGTTATVQVDHGDVSNLPAPAGAPLVVTLELEYGQQAVITAGATAVSVFTRGVSRGA